MTDALIVRGAREHNLKNVDLDIPRGALVVFSGLSGSGKSSLAFDTIFAEGQRRYVESLSSYARQFLGQMDKPKVDFIEGLSPAVSIDQKSTNRNPRSTVGTITEIHDYLRLLYARTGIQHCPVCDAEISRQSAEQMVDLLLEYPEGTRFQLLAPVVKGRKGEHVELLSSLQAQGFSRARIDGETMRLDGEISLAKTRKHTIEVVVDRLAVKADARTRITDSVETALRLSDGVLIADFVDEEPDSPARTRRFSEKRACPNEHTLELEEIEPRSFSFNAPYGACPECSGIGTRMEIDLDLVIPDEGASLADGAIAPWTLGSADHHQQIMSALADEMGFSMQTPYGELPDEVKEALLHGRDFQVHVRYKNRFGRERRYSTGFEGVIYFLQRRHEDTESAWARERYEQFMRTAPCPVCRGQRLRPEVLSVRIGNKSIADVSALPIGEAKAFLEGVEFTARQREIADEVLREIHARLGFLVDVGLNYLNLGRPAGSLSGGEAQRIRLATQIGSGLVGVLYVLDEPSIGLHQRDNQRLIQTLTRLRDLGNTLIVVEHDEDTLRTADWIVDIGPLAGEYGGRVVHSGTFEDLLKNPESITGEYLSGARTIEVPKKRRPIDPERQLTIVGARENNLRGMDVRIPLGTLTAVTGVSGSGKSTLVNDILYKVLAKNLNRARLVPGRHTRVTGLEHLDKVVHVDQSPIGRTPRSNPATYTGVWDRIRTLFAQTSEAKIRGYKAGRFSFNVKGGRCENCSGDGTIKIEMNFLPDVYVLCEVCKGARYNSETLQVHFKGKNVAEVLDMPISEGVEFFEAVPAIKRQLQTLVDVGLGYVRLGQSATTLSGGEAQRVKLSAELHKRSNGRSIYVLDEPTTGLHFEDVRKLLGVLQGLVDKGNSVIVIEHNLDVIKSADHIIDLGPEGGSGGGQLVAEGTPEKVARVAGSFTGQFLKGML
ncbi:MAG: excinuclease ABC subunit UvrA [Dermabacter sp.]|nr:excinuclease ABC subunit UvrA [Dermabacter sp.]